MTGRTGALLRLDSSVYRAYVQWAKDSDAQSINAHLETVLRNALRDAGRLPDDVAPIARRGRPRKPRCPTCHSVPDRPTQ